MHKVLGEIEGRILRDPAANDFFFVTLHLLTFIRLLIARGSHFEPLSTVSIAIASLILGKAVLIADILPPINRYPKKPLAYNVAWKSTVYLLMATIIHYWSGSSISPVRQAGWWPATKSYSRRRCGRISGP